MKKLNRVMLCATFILSGVVGSRKYEYTEFPQLLRKEILVGIDFLKTLDVN